MAFTIYAIVFAYTAVLWVVVLAIYSIFIESLDFGRLSLFALKSVVLVAIVAAVVLFVPYGGWVSLIVWGIGLLAIFRMDLWESRVLVFLVWGVNLGAYLLLRTIVASAAR